MENSTRDRRICQKISDAHDLFALWGEALGNDPDIGPLLKSLTAKIAASTKAMNDFGITSACRHCSEEDEYTCCGAGIENRYSSRLLLINLLCGTALPTKRFWENSCFFLSENGCRLKVRLVLCVNYLCLKIRRLGSSEELAGLQKITGEEMEAGFILEEAVKKFIAERVQG